MSTKPWALCRSSGVTCGSWVQVGSEDADEHLMIAISDANLKRYGIGLGSICVVGGAEGSYPLASPQCLFH